VNSRSTINSAIEFIPLQNAKQTFDYYHQDEVQSYCFGDRYWSCRRSTLSLAYSLGEGTSQIQLHPQNSGQG
jgi:hypothetical protein